MVDTLKPVNAAHSAPNPDTLRCAVAVARAEMGEAYIAVLRTLPPGARVAQAFSLWRSAREALIRQGLQRGLPEAEARAEAARRLLAIGDDPST